jgi:ribosome maturation factor RimP
MMATEEKQISLVQLVGKLLEEEQAYFLVSVNIRPINNISVFIDGDEGVTIEKCVKINRMLYKQIVETELFVDGAFSLEVSSPGVDEPLKLKRQYFKNIGRLLEIDTTEGNHLEGKLLLADESAIELEEERGKGKKKETIKHFLQYDHIKKAVVKVIF